MFARLMQKSRVFCALEFSVLLLLLLLEFGVTAINQQDQCNTRQVTKQQQESKYVLYVVSILAMA